jgi:hypothetical protein
MDFRTGMPLRHVNLMKLQELGFHAFQQNLRALSAADDDLSAAIAILLENKN